MNTGMWDLWKDQDGFFIIYTLVSIIGLQGVLSKRIKLVVFLLYKQSQIG